MSLFRSVVAALVIAAAVLLAPAGLLAQSGSGTITGIVKDSSGGAIPGAQVNVVNEATNVSVESTTDATGSYRVEDLVPGPYRVETSLDGFETAVRRIVLDAGQTATIDVDAEPGAIHAIGGRDGPARRGGRPGSADSGVGGEGRPRRPTPAPST